MKLEIGKVTMNYSQKGEMVKEKTYFTPTLNIIITKELEDQLKTIQGGDQKTVKDNADLLLASWFSTMNEVELNDRQTHRLDSEVVHCETYPDGNVKQCVIKYIFQEIKNN